MSLFMVTEQNQAMDGCLDIEDGDRWWHFKWSFQFMQGLPSKTPNLAKQACPRRSFLLILRLHTCEPPTIWGTTQDNE